MNYSTLKKANIPSFNEWAEKRYKAFNEKIDSFKDHEKYSWLRQYADDAMRQNTVYGYMQIQAEDFIKRIEQMPLDYIKDWLDGENELEWKSEFK